MPRGGKRSGAGRRPIVGESERWIIGAEVDNRLAEIAKIEAECRIRDRQIAAARRQQGQKVSRQDALKMQRHVELAHRELQSLHVSRRSREIKKIKTEDSESLILDARANIAALGGQFFSETLRRPKGHRTRIIAEVAEWATNRYAKRVTRSFVEDCFKKYRSFKKDLP